MAKKKEEVTEKVLDVDASIQGTIVFKDPVNLRVNGEFEGKLEARGSLTIGETAHVKANITGEKVTIAGRVTGNVTATESLTVIAPAKIYGDIVTPSLSVSEGALIEGRLRMGLSGTQAEELLSLEEVARYLEVEVALVREWAQKQKIPATREGDKWQFKKSEVDRWIQKERVQV